MAYVANLKFGAPPAAVTVTTATTEILAETNHREYAIIINRGSVAMDLAIGATAVTGTGIYVAPGGSYEISREHGNLTNQAVNGVTASSTTTATGYQNS